MNKRYPKKLYATNTTNEQPDWPTIPGMPIGLMDEGRGILRQEARGTQEIVAANGARLPTDGTTSEADKAHYEAIGIKLGPAVSGDPLFREAELPAGWKIVQSDEDSRTTHILDANGNQRGYIWYKAASYDRAAYVRILTRYWPEHKYSGNNKMQIVVQDRATKTAVWTSPTLESPGGKKGATPEDWEAYQGAQNLQHTAACAWLDKAYPGWGDPAKYWP